MALSPAQQTISKDLSRFRVVVAGRRFGKTHLSIRELCYHARLPNQEVWYVAPTYRQSKLIAWKKLKNKLKELNWIAKVNESELTVLLKNGSTIALKGADNYDSLRGVGLNFIVLDEFADIDPEAWYETLRPTLSDTGGKALFIGTPKSLNWAYELFTNTGDDSNWSSHQFTTLDGGRVPQDEIEQARRDLDERTFRQEYMATFETFSGRIYYAFDRAKNCVETVQNSDIILVGMDFNVDNMSAVIAVRKNDTLHVIDEVLLRGSDTQSMANELRSRYPRSKIMVYPDPAGAARKTSSAGLTDHIILANAGFVVKAPRSHTPVRDRINAVNSRLCSAMGTHNLLISSRCKRVIECLERQVYQEGSSQPDKSQGYDHMNDALGYMVDYLFPVTRDRQNQTTPQFYTHRIAN